MADELNAGGDEGEIKVKMILSAEDFARVLEHMPSPLTVEAGAAGGTGAAGSTEAKTRGIPINLEKAVRTSPTFMSIFKPVAAMMGINLGIQGILASSRVAQSYLGAMGKMFGAAIDLLMMPFIPLFNAILLGESMLIQWLITSGLLEAISKGVLDFMEFVKTDIGPHLKDMWTALQNWDWQGVADAIGAVLIVMGQKIVGAIDEKMGGPGKTLQQWMGNIPVVGDQASRAGAGFQAVVGEAVKRSSPLGFLSDIKDTFGGIEGIGRLTEGKLPTGGQAMSALNVLAPGVGSATRIVQSVLGGGGGGAAPPAQTGSVDARVYNITHNNQINGAGDPVATAKAIREEEQRRAADAGREGK